jgi:glycosyltransferase involved in cell wall biosynthesis
MKKIYMINDVCWMAEALSKYLPYEVERVTRSRGLVSKTIGLAGKVLTAQADLYHVFYVLQDAYLALRMGKRPIVGHACGSDVRDVLHSRWGWMVRHNLKNLDYVLSSQPTIMTQIKEYTDRAEYFPIPIDPQLFRAAECPDDHLEPRVLYSSPVDFSVKGTDKVFQAISEVKRPITFMAIKYGRDLHRAYDLSRRLDVKITWVDRLPHEQMADLYLAADVILGNFGVGQLDTTVIEAMACGRPVVHHLAEGFFPDVPLGSYHTITEFADRIQMLLTDRKMAEQQVQRQLDYVKIHRADHATKRLLEIYEKVS